MLIPTHNNTFMTNTMLNTSVTHKIKGNLKSPRKILNSLKILLQIEQNYKNLELPGKRTAIQLRSSITIFQDKSH